MLLTVGLKGTPLYVSSDVHTVLGSGAGPMQFACIFCERGFFKQ